VVNALNEPPIYPAIPPTYPNEPSESMLPLELTISVTFTLLSRATFTSVPLTVIEVFALISVVSRPELSTLRITLPELSTITHSFDSETIVSLNSAFRASKAVCCAVETGLLASDVLSTLPKPTCALVTLWGLFLLAIWLSQLVLSVGVMWILPSVEWVSKAVDNPSSNVLRTLPWLALKGLLVSVEVRLSMISETFTLLVVIESIKLLFDLIYATISLSWSKVVSSLSANAFSLLFKSSIKVACSLNLVVTSVPSTTTVFALTLVVSRPELSTLRITLPELSAITTSPELSSVMLGLLLRSL